MKKRSLAAEVIAEANAACRSLILFRKRQRSIRLGIEADTGTVSLSVPREAFEIFEEALPEMAKGNVIRLVGIDSELTTQKAAELLNVSRPSLVKLLVQGTIASRRVGSHRRVRTLDLLEYKGQQSPEFKIFEELLAHAQANQKKA
jgi:excisionase family DNA binding protein